MLAISYAPLVSALITLLVSAILLSGKVTKSLKNVPDKRSPHAIPTVGGVGLMAGVLSGWAIMFHAPSPWILLPLILLFALSVINDAFGLSVKTRFAVFCLAALSVAWGGGLFAANMILAIAAILIIVWMINLYKELDEVDGLGGGAALIGFSMYGVASLMAGDEVFAMICFSIGAAALGFLYFNFYPAQALMGSAGAVPLGFLVASVGIAGWEKNLWPTWFPVMVFSSLMLDSAVTHIKYLVWRGRCEHYYQYLREIAGGSRNAALIEYALMIFVGISALWSLQNRSAVHTVATAWGLTYGFAMVSLDRRRKLGQRKSTCRDD